MVENSNNNKFAEQCMKCDLRQETRRKVSYTVLGLLVTVVGIFLGISYKGLDATMIGIQDDIKVFAKSLQACQERAIRMETTQGYNEDRFRKIEREIMHRHRDDER